MLVRYHHRDIISWDVIEKESEGKTKGNDIILSANQPEPTRALVGHDYIALDDARKIALKRATVLRLING